MQKTSILAAILLGLLPPPVFGQDPAAATTSPFGKPFVYRTINTRELHAYVATPSRDFTGERPAIVTFHGGGFKLGAPQSFNPQSEYLVKLGVVTIEIEYRLLDPHTTVADCFSDARAAMRWVRANSKMLGVDPHKIVGAGGSAGGYLIAADAYLTGVHDADEDVSLSTVPNALVLYNPVLDGEPGSVLFPLVGDRFVELSPYLHIPANARSSPPVLILSGANDTTVGVDDLVDFRRRLKRAGASAQLFLYPGQEHGFFNHEPYIAATNAELARFLLSLGYINGPLPAETNPLPPDLKAKEIQ